MYLKYSGILSAGLFVFFIFQSCNAPKPASERAISRFNNIIPKPSSVNIGSEAFLLTKDTKITYDNDESQSVASLLTNLINPATGFAISPSATDVNLTKGYIALKLSGADATLGEEGYELTINSESIKLSANGRAGLFNGIQTLRQLLPEKIEMDSIQEGPWEIVNGTIRDTPEYVWRGSMLDVARHFLSVDEVKRYIDLISIYKMNVLHLGLSNDQGWRIEIKSWPNLATIGGSTQVGGGPGGYYTQEQYKDIVSYAAERNITIIPEIDLPGHTNAALASYGELNGGIVVPKEGRIETATQGDLGKDKPTQLYTGTEVGFSTLSLSKPATFKFVEDVIRELSEITPGPYIHIGGDEAHVTKKPDYIAFVNRFQEIVEANNKIMIGWEEIAQGDINSKSVAQYWAQSKFAEMAASKGAKIVMSPSKNVYLDMKYDTASRIGYHWAAYIEVDSSYKWKPEVKIAGVPKESILGVEAPLWGETIKNFEDVEYLAFPRLLGVAEIGWTPTKDRNWNDYKIRLGNQAKRLKILGVDYYRSVLVPWVD